MKIEQKKVADDSLAKTATVSAGMAFHWRL